VFGFIPESMFTFIPESRSESSRNPVHLDPGTAFTFPRNPHSISAPRRSKFLLISSVALSMAQ
jgi:hypothetical protein